MVVNISYLKGSKPLKDNMWITAEPIYQNVDIEFEELCTKIMDSHIQYSPYWYPNKKKESSDWSNSKQNLIIFDFDDGFTIYEAMMKFKGYEYIISTTKSHQTKKKGVVCDRYRVLLPAVNVPHDETIYFKMLEIMAEQLPIDTQVNTKTGGFLGNDYQATTWYEDGKPYDCSVATKVAEDRLFQESKARKARLQQCKTDVNMEDITEVKEQLDYETTRLILEDLGYEFRGNKFMLRDERSPSTILNESGFIKDFGGDFKGDIFDILYEYHDMNFGKSLDYVKNYIRSYGGS